MDGNHSESAKAEGSLTARRTGRADTKVGLSDPAVFEWKSRRSTGPKGLAVRQLKRHASWVQNVVRQFGPYPSWAEES